MGSKIEQVHKDIVFQAIENVGIGEVWITTFGIFTIHHPIQVIRREARINGKENEHDFDVDKLAKICKYIKWELQLKNQENGN